MKNFKVQWVAFSTLIINEVTRFLRVWPQSLLPSAITMSLYFLIFGHFIGSRVGTVDHVSYMDFIMPGLVMMAVITNSYTNVVSSFYTMRFIRCIDELLIAPVPNWLILCGFLSGGVLRGFLIGGIVMLIALFFTHITIHDYTLTILVVLLTSILFSLAGFTNGLFAKKFDDIAIVPTFILTPLTYLAGVFYSINQLPPVWRNISLFNPILYMVNTFRYGILGISDVGIYTALAVIAVAVVILFSLNLYFLKHGIGIRN